MAAWWRLAHFRDWGSELDRRVVVTGLGVLAPNGHGLDDFERALREGRSGIRFYEKLRELKFGCQVGGAPQGVEEIKERYFSEEQRFSMKSNIIAFGAIAALDCWRDAGMESPGDASSEPDFDTGAIIGTGVAGIDLMCSYAGPMIDGGRTRRMGSTIVEQVMCSGVSARIYAEVKVADVNSGGQRQGGSMTAPNPYGVQRCIRAALEAAGIRGEDVGAINGHLTATMADPGEIANWQAGLGVAPENFPLINSTKSMIGHSLGAAGGIECVASILELDRGFVHPSLNCEDLHPKLEAYAASIPHETREMQPGIIAKASFGFGDVNACVIFEKWDPRNFNQTW